MTLLLLLSAHAFAIETVTPSLPAKGACTEGKELPETELEALLSGPRATMKSFRSAGSWQAVTFSTTPGTPNWLASVPEPGFLLPANFTLTPTTKDQLRHDLAHRPDWVERWVSPVRVQTEHPDDLYFSERIVHVGDREDWSETARRLVHLDAERRTESVYSAKEEGPAHTEILVRVIRDAAGQPATVRTDGRRKSPDTTYAWSEVCTAANPPAASSASVSQTGAR